MWEKVASRLIQVLMGFIFTVLVSVNSYAISGRVGVLEDGHLLVKQTQLAEMSSILNGKWAEIIDPPMDLIPDENGCLCFETNDIRTAYVQAYYHATQMAQWANHLLEKTGCPTIPQLKIRLRQSLFEMPSGGAHDHGRITFSTSRPLFDPSILFHEIGHEIHLASAGVSILKLVPTSPIEDLTKFYQQSGTVEGVANIIAALYANESKIGRADWAGCEIDVDQWVQFPNSVPSLRSLVQCRAKNPEFSYHYPTTAQLSSEMLSSPPLPGMLEQPDPYLASAVFTQPLWLASKIWDVERVLRILLPAIHARPSGSTYSELARAILTVASERDQEVGEFLSAEFEVRGI